MSNDWPDLAKLLSADLRELRTGAPVMYASHALQAFKQFETAKSG